MSDRIVPPNPESSWSEYFEAASTKPAHPLYSELDRHLGSPGLAAELGCGFGQGVIHLAERGWHVLAVDALPEPLDDLRGRLTGENVGRVTLEQAFLEELSLREEGFDLVVAGFSLFFVAPSDFMGVWVKIAGSIKPGGIFMGQFLGPNDSWARPSFSMQSEEEVQDLLHGFSTLYWEHVERDGKSVQGYPKHWDVTHVIARKASPGPE